MGNPRLAACGFLSSMLCRVAGDPAFCRWTPNCWIPSQYCIIFSLNICSRWPPLTISCQMLSSGVKKLLPVTNYFLGVCSLGNKRIWIELNWSQRLPVQHSRVMISCSSKQANWELYWQHLTCHSHFDPLFNSAGFLQDQKHYQKSNLVESVIGQCNQIVW